LLGDPLLSELPTEYSGKNRSPFPHAKRMLQKQGLDVGREQRVSIPWRRSKKMLRVEDSTSQADLKCDLFGNIKDEKTLKSPNLDMAGDDLYTPGQEHTAEWDTFQKCLTRKYLPLTHFLGEEDVGHAPLPTSDMASLINFDALDLDFKDSLHRDLTKSDLYSSLDFDLGMDEGRRCDISYDDSVSDCSHVHGDPLLVDPLLSEIPSQCSGKNGSPFPHATLTWQKQGLNVGREQESSILSRRRMLRVEDVASQADLKWDLFGKAEAEVDGDVYTPLHEIWKNLPLTHSFNEDDVELHAPVSELKLDVSGKNEAQNVDTVGGDLYPPWQCHTTVLESFEKSWTKKNLPDAQSCNSEGGKMYVLAGPPVLALRRKRSGA